MKRKLADLETYLLEHGWTADPGSGGALRWRPGWLLRGPCLFVREAEEAQAIREVLPGLLAAGWVVVGGAFHRTLDGRDEPFWPISKLRDPVAARGVSRFCSLSCALRRQAKRSAP